MTANLPDNVTAVTTYTVKTADGCNVITVQQIDAHVCLKQDDDRIILTPDDVPGLIAALQAVAGVPPEQDGPAYVIDGDGDTWTRNGDGTYRFGHMHGGDADSARTLDHIRSMYGIRETS